MPAADRSVLSLSLSAYLQNSHAGLLATDARHRCIWANQVLLERAAAGPQGERVIGRPFQQVARHFGQMAADPAAFIARINELRRKKKPFSGWEVLFADQHILQVSYTPLIEAGRFMGSIWQVVDVTAQKRLRSVLEQARREAAEAGGALRTPLNAIIGMAHLLEETRLDTRQREYVNILKHSSGILQGLIWDTQGLSGARAGELLVNCREFNLAELVHALRYTFELKQGQQPVRITAEIDPKLRTRLIGDDVLLNQILLDLLGNAETVTAEGEIIIRITPESWQDNKLWIRFRICGTGTRIRHGACSAVTRQLIELLGGNVTTEELPEFHTCFSFILPFIDTRKPAVAGRRQRQVDFTGARVLVIVDNPMNLRYIASLLEKYSIEYQLATNSPDALYFLDSRQYDLILMDIRIPGLNGFELADKIRGDERKPNVATPLVATTALAMESTFTLARQAGITDILTKPYTPDQLLQVLSKYLNDDETEQDVNARFSRFDGTAAYIKDKITSDETGVIMEETTNIPGFEFHRELDVKYLNVLYENNIPYAADLFEIFLKTVKEELARLQALVDARDWEQLKFQVHKLKPNFAMVGLTWISSRMQQLENTLSSNATVAPDNVHELFDSISADLEKFYPIIAHEYERMLEFIH